MPDIRYVCLSDMHLGAGNSLLTNLRPASPDADPTLPGTVLAQLVICLKELISQNESRDKPILVLNGDILELALASDNIAAMAFQRFMELIIPKRNEALFAPEIIYIPGNHDHHLWETARETQYVQFISRKGTTDTLLEIPWHATKMFEPDYVPSCFLEGIVHMYKHLKHVRVKTVYPNFGLISNSGKKCVAFTHGHFTESIYMLMSILRSEIFPGREKPRLIWDYEAENFAWIDFFWSTLGRSGDIGKDIELIYDKLRNRARTEELLTRIFSCYIEEHGRPHIARSPESKLLGPLLGKILSDKISLERSDTDNLLSSNGRKGLHDYLEGPLRQQILLERDQTMPLDMTFVFGHTHKPFENDSRLRGYPDPASVYNSGGWVVDSVTPKPLYGGSVILVDEELNVCSIRAYNEASNRDGYKVTVESATHPGMPANPFQKRMQLLIDAPQSGWRKLSEIISEAVPLYEANLQSKMTARD